MREQPSDRPGQASLLPRLEAAAELGRSVTFLDADPDERVPWARIHEDARALAGALQGRGVGPGDRVALVAPTSRPLLTAIQATWLAGATLMVVPLRTRLTSEEEFTQQTHDRIALADASITVADPELAGALDVSPLVTYPELESEARLHAYERPPDDGDAVAILQFTSGSTADPKGVMIPHRCVTDNLDGLSERAPLGSDDVVVTWLPVYHDMGLVYVLTNSMITGAELVISTPQYFIASPGRWMEALSASRGTWTIAPDFAFGVAARMLAHSGRLDLSAVRRLGSGSEPIHPASMRALEEHGTDHGLDVGAMYGAYGMAEATVVISAPSPGTGFGVDHIDGELLEREQVAEPVAPDHKRARALARCGAPIPNMDCRVVDAETLVELGERRVGEVEVRGPSVVPGYFRRPDATAAAFHDGWLRTGDLGYLADGEVVICGRLKDVIVVGGRNVFPQDIERAVEKVGGIRPGNVIAFGTEGRNDREQVVVAAEIKADDVARVRRDVARSVVEAVGLRPADVVLLPPGSIPKTSSGKLRRGLCRNRYITDEFDPL